MRALLKFNRERAYQDGFASRKALTDSRRDGDRKLDEGLVSSIINSY